MVHLSRVSRGDSPDSHAPPTVSSKANTDASGSLAKLTLDDELTTTVYGSRFAAQALPEHTLLDDEMPRDVAYRMIKDELSLDGNPKMK